MWIYVQILRDKKYSVIRDNFGTNFFSDQRHSSALLRIIKRLSASFSHQTFHCHEKLQGGCMHKINTCWFIGLRPPYPMTFTNKVYKSYVATCRHATWFLKHWIKDCIASPVIHEQNEMLFENDFEALQQIWKHHELCPKRTKAIFNSM